ncbi:MAG: Lecithin:cholesterol acyltransferase [Candidatus Collierbacteria bacterium GW2011_GWA2_42_17]|uniref:Lecithin:cholesterol acyltransferase n=1 Tax=Candidatus Collierbacteria bacterium GW2011_GWA2_42_17 TaxID=1618378 RepID=A0A0G0Z1V6_9BACT|nr:MAG: Lecithin:cholesterol acyltransferase [Candidatus Collierbacteria bacterium GW2011_GWA2_42_17]
MVDKIEIEFKFRFTGTPNFGAGFVLSDKLLPYGITREVAWEDVVFIIWPKQVSGFTVNTVICPNTAPSCIPNHFNSGVFNGLSNEWYTLKMQKDGNKYYLYVDGIKVYESSISERQIRYIWLGNPEFTNGVAWPTIDIDYIKISELSNTSPTILIPGLGASWDMGAILSGTDGNNWTVPSFVKEYNGLISSFINTKDPNDTDRNLYIFPYDWRKPLSVLAERLKVYIDTNISTGEKVNLVGHSMGGLVARAYTQTYGTSKINKIITVGSPNKGVTEAYGVWEGATIWNDVWWAKMALELTTHFGANVGESNVQTVQRLVPSLRDLLPVYDFIKKDALVIPWSTLSQKNLYLGTLNQNVSQINSLTTAIYSKDIETNKIVKVIAPSEEDLALQRWVDGKPISDPFETADGDGTITEDSAKGTFSNILRGSGWHGELVTKNDNIQKIFGVLGLDQTKIISGNNDGRKNALVVVLRSPGKLEVCNIEVTKCNDQLGLYFPDYKLFMLPGYDNEELMIRVFEDGNKGTYKLHIGNIGDTSDWNIFDGNIVSNDQHDYYIVKSNGKNLSIQSSPANKEQCKKDRWKVMYDYFGFRNQGECVSYVERNERASSRFFWWI